MSCARCRRLKVRCDREFPCGRCSRAGKNEECDYSHSSKTSRQSLEDTSHSGKSPWHSRFLTRSHWALLVEDVSYIILSLSSTLLTPQIRELTMPHFVHPTASVESAEMTPAGIHRVSNFPFSDRPGRVKASRKSLLSILPDRATAEVFIQNYLDTIEQAYTVIHLSSFKSELIQFWEDPHAVNDGWLALFFAILSLGCHAYNATAHGKQDPYPGLDVQFLDASEACLKATPLMYYPEKSNIQTLYLMVIFKQLDRMSCHQTGACWPLTGLIVRLSMMLGMHVNHAGNGALSDLEIQHRKDLWMSVILLEMRQSLVSGMPLLLQVTDFPGIEPVSDDSVKTSFYKSIPLITKVLSTLNHNRNQLEHDNVLEYDLQLRKLLKDPNLSLDCQSKNYPARLLFNVFYRRLLLALHTSFAQEPRAWTQYPVSYWSTLDSCLGLLAVQRELCEQTDNKSANGRSGHLMAWFAGLFREDFFTAAMTLCHHLVKANSPLEPSVSTECFCQQQARDTIMETLVSCSGLWAREKGLSVCHREASRVMSSVIDYLRVQ